MNIFFKLESLSVTMMDKSEVTDKEDNPLLKLPPDNRIIKIIDWDMVLYQQGGRTFYRLKRKTKGFPILLKRLDVKFKPEIAIDAISGERWMACRLCGEQFKLHDIRQLYCSKECKTRNLNNWRAEEKNRKDRGQSEPRCHECDGILSSKRGAKFCGVQCRVKYWRKKKNRE
jgi:endogenous inhibitor of DNA gyrase (YacG/DUF329 family)